MSKLRHTYGFQYRLPWLRSHSNLIYSDIFAEDRWRASQNSWAEAYWDARQCIKYRQKHRELYKNPYNTSSLIRVLALYIILLAVMFAILIFSAYGDSHALTAKLSAFVVPYIIIAGIVTWAIFCLYRHKVDYYWRLYSRRLHTYEIIWPGIKKLAQTGHENGVTETPPPLTRRDRNSSGTHFR